MAHIWNPILLLLFLGTSNRTHSSNSGARADLPQCLDSEVRKSGMSTLHSLNCGKRIRVSKARSTVGFVEEHREREGFGVVTPLVVNPHVDLSHLQGSTGRELTMQI